MNTIAEMKYTGDGGNAQRVFIKDAQVGWKNLLNDPNKHLSNVSYGNRSCTYTTGYRGKHDDEPKQ